jgi:hypothetical protein
MIKVSLNINIILILFLKPFKFFRIIIYICREKLKTLNEYFLCVLRYRKSLKYGKKLRLNLL